MEYIASEVGVFKPPQQYPQVIFIANPDNNKLFKAKLISNPADKEISYEDPSLSPEKEKSLYSTKMYIELAKSLGL